MNIIMKMLHTIFVWITVFSIKNVDGELKSKHVVVAKDGHDLSEAYDLFELLTTAHNNSNTTVTTPKPAATEFWMKKMGDIPDDLMNIQAFIVKDEEVEGACIQGQQKSDHRYLMCAGSILNRNKVLTTASCLHEAINIRHNIRAPLAVVIAPLKPTVQVIRVAEYRIHPQHNTNPYSNDHTKHNLAILSLACRISSVNYDKIDLPTLPMTHICAEENCIIAVYRKSGYINVIYKILAPQIPLYDRRRRSIIDESKSKWSRFNKKMKTDVFYDDTDLKLTMNNSFHPLVKRSSDGTKNCPQTGSAVMVNKTQTAILALSCDDRQGNNASFLYTDLYYNKDWIHSILHDWNKSDSGSTEQSHLETNKTQSSKNCGNCIFNFYISVGCKGKANCPRNQGISTNNLQPKITHTARQVSNREFMQAWTQASESTPNSWSARRFASDNIRSSTSLPSNPLGNCPSNAPECLQALPDVNEASEILPANRIQEQEVNTGDKPTRFIINNPIIRRSRNHSRFNGFNKISNISDLQNLGNRTWIFRKFNKPQQNNHERKNFNDEKLIEERNNWLRRRHTFHQMK